MNVWTLILILDAGIKSAAPVVIDNLVSYDECKRVAQVITTSKPLMGSYGWDNYSVDYYRADWVRSVCVENKKAK